MNLGMPLLGTQICAIKFIGGRIFPSLPGQLVLHNKLICIFMYVFFSDEQIDICTVSLIFSRQIPNFADTQCLLQ